MMKKFHLLIFDLKVTWKEYMNNQLKCCKLLNMGNDYFVDATLL